MAAAFNKWRRRYFDIVSRIELDLRVDVDDVTSSIERSRTFHTTLMRRLETRRRSVPIRIPSSSDVDTAGGSRW